MHIDVCCFNRREAKLGHSATRPLTSELRPLQGPAVVCAARLPARSDFPRERVAQGFNPPQGRPWSLRALPTSGSDTCPAIFGIQHPVAVLLGSLTYFITENICPLGFLKWVLQLRQLLHLFIHLRPGCMAEYDPYLPCQTVQQFARPAPASPRLRGATHSPWPLRSDGKSAERERLVV